MPPRKPNQPATSPIPKVLQREFAKAIQKLSERAKERISFLLKSSTILNENTITEIQNILEQELNDINLRAVIEKYVEVFYERGAFFAEKMLERYGIEIKLPPSMFSILDQETFNYLNNIQLDLIKTLKEEEKKKLALKLREGILVGKSNKEIIKDILSVVDDAEWKIERIVRTESSRVFNLGSISRYEKAGIKKWQWLTALDERTCLICSEKHGKIVSDRSEIPPHASHPNCRCTVVPFIDLLQ